MLLMGTTMRDWAAGAGLFVTALVMSQSGIVMPSGVATAAAPSVAHVHRGSAVRGDLDGDGRSDLVALLHDGDVRVDYTRAHPAGHHVHVLKPGSSDAGGFTSVAVGDFNGDGFADLALGVTESSLGTDGTPLGAVAVYYGSTHGLTAKPTVFIGPTDHPGGFGSSLAAGDVTGDGYDDLAVGSPQGASGAGSVLVYSGSARGLTATGAQPVTSLRPEAGGEFGAAVTFADVNGDGHDDLVVGEPMGHPGSQHGGLQPGDIQVFDGTRRGIGSTHRRITGAAVGTTGRLGSALAAGNIDGTGPTDVVASAPYARVADHPDAGSIVVFRGGASGLSPARHQTVGARFTHLKKSSQGHAYFGSSLAVGDVTGDGRSDVIVGAPPAMAPHPNFGAVYVLHGSAQGVTARGAQRLTQPSVGDPGLTPRASLFGASLAVLVTGRGARREVAIGLPGANFGGRHTRKGAVMVLHGTAHGLSTHPVRVIKGTKLDGELGVGLAP